MKVNKFIKRHVQFIEIRGKRGMIIDAESIFWPWTFVRCVNICDEYLKRYWRLK